MKHLTPFNQFINEGKKPKGAPDWHDSDAPEAEGRFRDLNPKDLAQWLIKTRKGDLKKITGSINQQIVFNRNDDPEYSKKMEKTREEVYKQLGREDLLKEIKEAVTYSSSIINGKRVISNWAAETNTESEFIKLIKDLPETLEFVNVPVSTNTFNPETKKFKGPITSSTKNSIIKIVKDISKQFKKAGDPVQKYSIKSYYSVNPNLDKHKNDPAYIQFSTKGSERFSNSMSSGKFGPLD